MATGNRLYAVLPEGVVFVEENRNDVRVEKENSHCGGFNSTPKAAAL